MIRKRFFPMNILFDFGLGPKALTYNSWSYRLVMVDTCANSYDNQAKDVEIMLPKRIVSTIHYKML